MLLYISKLFQCTLLIVIHGILTHFSNASPLQLTTSSMDQILNQYEVLFVNFYADWCHFSQMLTPIYDETSQAAAKEFDPNRIALGRIDCDAQSDLCARYRVNKYPTLKLFRWGQPLKSEYRGQRSKDAFIEYIRKEIQEKIRHYSTENATQIVYNDDSRYIVGYFASVNTPTFELFKKLSVLYSQDCIFLSVKRVNQEGEKDYIQFRNGNQNPIGYPADQSLDNYENLSAWVGDRCVPLVRTLTFQNAEELTEEGKPLLILFHRPEDTESAKIFKEACQRELIHEKYNMIFLTADGIQFSHPLHHLGKSANDLPFLCIDSLKHMYPFNHNLMDALKGNGKLRQFIADLNSGKLHREFHYGPDPVSEEPAKEENVQQPDSEQQPDVGLPVKEKKKKDKVTSPPISVFKKLSPSKTRYSLLKDEL